MGLYEYYNVSDPALDRLWGDFWQCQSFTPVVAHTITSVKLTLYRLGLPGTLDVAVKATDGSGLPTGVDLASGSTDGDTLPEIYSAEKREVSLGAGVALLAGTKYEIVVHAASGDQSNYVRWRHKSPSCYPRGAHGFSSDGGVTWEEDLTRDMMFEEWGNP